MFPVPVSFIHSQGRCLERRRENGGAREERRPPHCRFHQSSEGLQSSSSSEAEAEAEALQEVGIGWSGGARTRARRRRSADFFLLASLPSRDAHLTIEENSSLVGLALRRGGSGSGLDDDDDDRDARAAPRSPQKASRQTKLVPSSWLSVHYYVSCLSCTSEPFCPSKSRNARPRRKFSGGGARHTTP